MFHLGNLKRFLKRLWPTGSCGKEFTLARGSVIPAPDRRWCGQDFKDDDFNIRSAEREASRLIEHFRATRQTRVLDVGCGQGRLPIGILRVIGELD